MKLLTEIENVVATGKMVTSASDQTIIDLVKAAILKDLSASFYLTRAQAYAVTEWYWTPERIQLSGIRPVPHGEFERIRRELGVELTDFNYAPIKCSCGHIYDAFDFFQQGIREHGLEVVNSIFSMTESTLLQVNPSFTPICPVDNQKLEVSLRGGGTYRCTDYGGCCIGAV
ncbi:hypothetical protein [Streptomyces sp. NRRL S-350]|uniref:hypothetical protein n=1 Tax=Streptomyces sp. NRRL S-350 TaxID=1463902 RepID=UPI00055BCB59|nr:hypothetical protein [Streptomyces sp. NRRL S-350]